ncbi:MAG: sigma-54-dependent Fis family transcriptional regulator [Deltaproteobacteria bacterium]|nr:sigma-54-dependent Fis family transcriptional regulator [Deltaproteobacteria bacterium]
MQKILIVDDERNIRKVLSTYLKKEGFEVETARNYEESLSKIGEQKIDLVLTDMRLPGPSGLHLLQWIKRNHTFLPVILITAFGSIDSAVEAMKSGASNYLTKPMDMDEMMAIIRHTLMKSKGRNTADQAEQSEERFGIIGRSAAINEVISTIQVVSSSRANVLITGESGTGKELVAGAIHAASPRKELPFIAINCAAVPADLIENELFGHESGAFTGAVSREAGKIELADRGTLFLDEIGEMSLSMQIKLLRFMQERVFFRIGGKSQIASDCRIIAATNRDLEEEVKKGRFREDFFYRLNVIQIRIPPLRDRKGDVPLLVKHFLDKYSGENKKFIRGIDSVALDALIQYEWPGNIRELQNIIERGVVLSRHDTIALEDLPNKLKNNFLESAGEETPPEDQDLLALSGMTLAELERIAVVKSLKVENWNQTRAAKRLGITRRQLRTKMEKYKLL